MTDSTGANDDMAQHFLGESIANGLNIHLLSSAVGYTDGDTEIQAASEASEAIAAADLTTNSATGFDDQATITNDVDVVFDVSGITESTTITHLALQDQTNTDRFLLSDETNNPDIGDLDTYTIEAGTELYEFGNPV